MRTSCPAAAKLNKGYLWVANAPGGSLFYHWGIGREADQLIGTLGKTFCGDILLVAPYQPRFKCAKNFLPYPYLIVWFGHPDKDGRSAAHG